VIALLVLAYFASRTLEQVESAVSWSERSSAVGMLSTYQCLGDRLAELPSGERYWIGDPTTDPAGEMWRQRLVQRSFPAVQLADSEADATVRLDLRSDAQGRGCDGFVLVATPIGDPS